MNKFFTLLTGMSVGAGLMYFYDPARGNRRRALMNDQIDSSINQAGDAWNEAIVDLRNRSQGVAHEISSIFERQPATENNPEGMLSPSARLLLVTGGGMLAVYGRVHKGLIGTALSLAGMSLLARGVTNTNYKRMLGIGQVYDAINVQKTINIPASPEELYRFWENFTNFPRFMQHVKEVEDLGGGRSHWVVDGPAGSTVEWDAVITENIPNEYIAWTSDEESEVMNEGSVRFQPNNRGGTRLTVHIGYTPPAGVFGHAVATMFGANPKQEMDEDMQRLKTLYGEGSTTVKGRKVTGEDLSDKGV